MKVSELQQSEQKTEAVLSPESTKELNDVLYAHAQQFLPAWIPKWDAALAQKDWPKVRTLIRAAYKHAKYPMPLPDLVCWWPEPQKFWPTVQILDRQGISHGRFALEIMATDKQTAEAALLASGYRVISW